MGKGNIFPFLRDYFSLLFFLLSFFLFQYKPIFIDAVFLLNLKKLPLMTSYFRIFFSVVQTIILNS